MTVIAIRAPLTFAALIALASSQHGPEGHLRLPKSGVTERVPHDHLRSSQDAVAWLRARREFSAPRAAPSAADLATLREIRAALRDLARGRVGAYERGTELLLRGTAFELQREGALAAVGAGWPRFAAAFLPALVAIERERTRLKRCANERCGWLFLDRSAARTRRWCDMNACGNRVKARRFRARARRTRRATAHT